MKIRYTIKEFDPYGPLEPGDYFRDPEFKQWADWAYLVTRVEGNSIYRKNLNRGSSGENLYCNEEKEIKRLLKIHPKDIGKYELQLK